ncbi:sigma-54-dependent transcriptional regulator [Methylophilus medardicus]|uniref:Sigma-54-dependent Fis family transcriptional regulator n=1 Tax=Methylophilus medardicus TaxID=2588534 RepID=A0A5B8CPU9_9PROT|nr:response regulator [Methylophilus medardicus]QDC43275.1 sigma-54-dependent Fis family transcriptional regulator [Methylophilus medardicus]QDC48282.1 sigma-54-dependent Fis family transcriptional regulator [Methylophilus medardicus]QDC51987.1 sigma-54-dependent Fis family transcriptional regulator [Methylophilus medardicus]
MASRNILVVDDEIGIRELLSDILRDEGHIVRLAENAQVARDERLKLRPDLVLLDIWMPDCDGISLLKEWANAGLLTMPVIMMSGHGTIDTAVEATRLGAFDFLEKPIALQKLLKTVSAAIKHTEHLAHTEINLSSFGKSAVIQELKQRLEQLARHKNTLFLIGKKGGSVPLCAKFLRPQNTPWVALTDYEKLVTAPMEILEQAREGVVFVDEVTKLGKTEQKGLHLLINKSEKYGVRVICASEHGLPQLIEKAMLEQALLQTLAGSAVKVPCLDEHKEDIPDLVNAMATLMVEASKIDYKALDVAALNALRNADWPGDLDELESVVQNLLMTSLEDTITQADVQRVLANFQGQHVEATEQHMPLNLDQPLREARDEFERYYFQYHMRLVKNNMSRLSEISGLERTHLYRKLKQLGIKIKG